MTGRISRNAIAQKALAGMEKAHEQYVQWSGGFWLQNAPEYLATVNIAQEIGGLAGTKYITLEHKPREVLAEAGAIGRGRLHRDIRVDGRFDLVVWWASGRPRMPIEVKLQVTGIGKILDDVKRIGKVVERKADLTTIQSGLIVYYTSLNDHKSGVRTAVEKIAEYNTQILQDARTVLGSTCLVTQVKPQKIHTDYKSAWAASGLLIQASISMTSEEIEMVERDRR
nr:hypothetical protein [uncultured Pseudogulbenkiania sp.]